MPWDNTTLNTVRSRFHAGEAARYRSYGWLWLTLALIYVVGAYIIAQAMGLGALVSGLIAALYRQQAHHHQILADWYLGRDNVDSK